MYAKAALAQLRELMADLGLAPKEAKTRIVQLVEGGEGLDCPRIHFMDNTKGTTGRVIVGYIGPHLTNTKTH